MEHGRSVISTDPQAKRIAKRGSRVVSENGGPPLPKQTTAKPQGADMTDAREVMNVRQASHYLGISPDTLYKYVSEEIIPAFRLGNRWKFKKSILDGWMEQRSLNSEAERPTRWVRMARNQTAGD
jgi:excisionase family DNA binding protein